jgi:tripartite-type tricarboxylate transporter receptor subunit TctC
MRRTTTGRWLLAIGCVVLTLIISGTAFAQGYPNRPIRLIVGYAAGGSVDIVCRILADKLSQRLGQQVVVDNRPGGGTQVASSMLVKSEPDGYTLMMADIAHGANPALNAKLPYDTLKDFEPIVLVAVFPSILAVDQSLPGASG